MQDRQVLSQKTFKSSVSRNSHCNLRFGSDPTSTLRITLDGAQTVIAARTPKAGSMPAYRDKLTDQAIAAVTSYIRNSWGDAARPVDADQVAKARAER
jgi:mono/diheme cytochrome c family protein